MNAILNPLKIMVKSRVDLLCDNPFDQRLYTWNIAEVRGRWLRGLLVLTVRLWFLMVRIAFRHK